MGQHAAEPELPSSGKPRASGSAIHERRLVIDSTATPRTGDRRQH